MPSYPAKPFVIPHDDWFNNNSSNSENNSETKERKNISTIHEFFYRQSDVKIGGSDNHIKTNMKRESSSKIFIRSFRNSMGSLITSSGEKYSYSQIPTKVKSIKKRSFHGIKSYKNSSNRNIFNFRSYFLDLKSVFFKIINRKKS
tara:strand:+ start:43 stop:477 length:435 start_codon:yes stop_codon:yes gene_type:complete